MAGGELLRLPLLGVLAIPGGIMFYAYIAHRYTSEFIPVLLFGSAIGLVDITRRLLGRSRRVKGVVLGGLALLVAFGVASQMAAAYNTRALANPGGVLQDYVSRQQRVSDLMGDPIADHVTFSDHVTLDAEADELRIIDDCQALYIGTGDEFRPWEEVGVRPMHLRIEVTGDPASASVGLPLARFDGHEEQLLLLERTEGVGFRLVMRGGGFRAPTSYTAFEEGDDFTVDVDTSGALVQEVVGSNGQGFDVEKQSYDADWRWLPQVFRPIRPNPGRMEEMGVEVETLPSEPLAVCERLQDVAAP